MLLSTVLIMYNFIFSWSPRKAHHERYTLLRSIHVHKRCRVQYEVRTWFRFIHFHKLTGSTAETFLEYVQRNLPEGVALKVTKVSYFHLIEFKLILIINIKKIVAGSFRKYS